MKVSPHPPFFLQVTCYLVLYRMHLTIRQQISVCASQHEAPCYAKDHCSVKEGGILMISYFALTCCFVQLANAANFLHRTKRVWAPNPSSAAKGGLVQRSLQNTKSRGHQADESWQLACSCHDQVFHCWRNPLAFSIPWLLMNAERQLSILIKDLERAGSVPDRKDTELKPGIDQLFAKRDLRLISWKIFFLWGSLCQLGSLTAVN